jgi:hypothetical protein
MESGVRFPFLALLLIPLLVPTYAGDSRRGYIGDKPVMTLTPVVLDEADPSRRRLGALTFLAGYRLDSPDPQFGGFSSMRLQGDRFTLLSDGGALVSFRLSPAGQASEVSFRELPAGPGRGWTKAERDSESMASDPVTGQVWVGFERVNEIWRFSPDFSHAEGRAAPRAMRRWVANGGPEAMVRLRNGGFIVLAESPEGPGRPSFGLYFDRDPVETPQAGFRFRHRFPPGYRPTDIAELPDGRLLVLVRHFSPRPDRLFEAKLMLIDRAAIRQGALVRGTEIADFSAPTIHDNFEALVVTREGDATILWIASDDNQMFWQRSLLLKFRLDLPPPGE